MSETQYEQCTKCQRLLPITEFFKNKKGKCAVNGDKVTVMQETTFS